MLLKKRILVIGINYKPELTGIGKYTGEMVDWLIEQGFEVSVITGFPYYPYWKIQQPYKGIFYKKEVFHDGKLTVYRCPFYVPSKPTGLKRQIHDASFFVSALFMVIYLALKKRFDWTMCVAPPFHLGLIALFYKLLRYTPVIYHIQDLQIDAAQILGILKRNWVFKLLFRIERFILNKADIVTTISEGMKRKIQFKTANPVALLPNWVDTTAFYPLGQSSLLKTKLKFMDTDKVVLYSGSIGEKQGLDMILKVAKNLENYHQIKFVICGIGPFKERLIKMAKEMALSNLNFIPLQPHAKFNELLNLADVHLVLQKSDASDLVMPSKLTTILAVGGLALVTAGEGTTLHDVIINNKIGYVLEPDQEMKLEEAILNCCLKDFSAERKNARRYALTHLHRETTLAKLKELLNG